jgi:hypothetical protein
MERYAGLPADAAAAEEQARAARDQLARLRQRLHESLEGLQ